MKKLALIAALVLALPFVAATAAHAADTEKTDKTAAKIPQKALQKKEISRRAAKAVESVTPVSDETNITLSEEDLAVAQRVLTGTVKCELGANVTVTADAKRTGFFNVSTKGLSYRMHPVESRTGAIRLEDPKAGAMWLQISNKSMLLNQKQGLRIADECQDPIQIAFAEEMKKNPPKSLFDTTDSSANPAAVIKK